jgi:SNF2 family DNA or RNA helicase
MNLEDIDSVIEKYQLELAQQAIQETELNNQIAALTRQIGSIRQQIAKTRDGQLSTKQSMRQAQKDRESALRKRALEEEAVKAQQTLEQKRKDAEAIIAEAPWKDIAFDWQIDGVLRLPDRGILADKRGLGKTLSSLIWRRLKGSKRTLVCVRSEVAPDFIKEIGIREPGLFVYPLVGATAEQRNHAAFLLNSLPDDAEFIVVTNIESWRRSVDKTTDDILKIKFDGIILDEAHHIKTVTTGTAQGFFRLADKVPKILELTGTPIKNRPQEMFSLLHALYPQMFPRMNKFLIDYCRQIDQNKWVFTAEGVKALVATIDHFYTARSPEDIGREIPPPRMIEYHLNMDAHEAQKKAYQDMTERSLAVLDSGKVLPIVSQLALMTRQAQVVSWPAGIVFNIKDEEGVIVETVRFDIHESVKMDWAEELTQELVGEGERVVLFSRFKPAIYELKRRLEEAGLRVAVITGDEKAKGNTERVFNDFDLKTAPKDYLYDVLLATYQTVGESANLNAARHMILYDRFWNPGNDDQAIGRIDRINSIDQATVHLPAVEKTIDEYMIELINGKRNIVGEFREASLAESQANLVAHLRKSIE